MWSQRQTRWIWDFKSKEENLSTVKFFCRQGKEDVGRSQWEHVFCWFSDPQGETPRGGFLSGLRASLGHPGLTKIACGVQHYSQHHNTPVNTPACVWCVSVGMGGNTDWFPWYLGRMLLPGSPQHAFLCSQFSAHLRIFKLGWLLPPPASGSRHKAPAGFSLRCVPCSAGSSLLSHIFS